VKEVRAPVEINIFFVYWTQPSLMAKNMKKCCWLLQK